MTNAKNNLFVRVLLIILASLIFAFNINIFVHSGALFPGGFSGVALLIQSVFKKFWDINLPYSILTYAMNIIPIYIGFRFIGKKFTWLSCLLIFLSGLFTDILQNALPNLFITDDVLLCAIFGGIVNAIAVSLCLYAESSSGGTDFIAIFISEKTGKSAWNLILAFNSIVLVIAGLLLSWKSALYSIIFQYTSTQALNFLYKKYEKTTLLIITDKADELYQLIKTLTNHDATVLVGKGAYSGKEKKMLYTVVSSSECGQLEKAIRIADPDAFINVLKSKEIVGKFFKKNPD